MGKITEEQRNLIEKFHCERLSHNGDNRELIKKFVCKKGKGLVNYLQENAWEEDVSGQVAYYLIKDTDGEIALFFSLKCGSLFEPLNEEKLVELKQENIRTLLEMLRNTYGVKTERDAAEQIIEMVRTGQKFSAEEIQKLYNVKLADRKIEEIREDRKREINEKIVRVRNTYPGVELFHFCTNDEVKDKWINMAKENKISHTLGEVMFWQYIVPIICDVQELIGCQYAFLFAADVSEDGTLINYYDVSLNFKQMTEVGTNKPWYDMCCQFMCQEVNMLRERREEYFDSFNPDEDDVVV